jgi:beta-phosphoglucomutase-like phosphatase (HAD superfamily)
LAIEAVLFDIDGTLVDSNDSHVLAWEEAFRNAGYEFDRQTIHDQIGKGSDMLVPFLLPHLGEAAHEEFGDAHGEIGMPAAAMTSCTRRKAVIRLQGVLVHKSAVGRGSAAIAVCQAMRCDTGMPSRVIRLSTEQATRASVFWLGRVRARRPRPMMVLYRNTAVSPSERLP